MSAKLAMEAGGSIRSDDSADSLSGKKITLEGDLDSKESMMSDSQLTKGAILLRIAKLQEEMSAAGMKGLTDFSVFADAVKKEYLINILFDLQSSLESWCPTRELDRKEVLSEQKLVESPFAPVFDARLLSRAIDRSSKREQKAPRLLDVSKQSYLAFRQVYQAYQKGGGMEELYDLFSPDVVFSLEFQLSMSDSELKKKTSSSLLSLVDNLLFPQKNPSARLDILRGLSMKPETVFNRMKLEVYLGQFMSARRSTASMATLTETSEIRVFIIGVSPKSSSDYLFRLCGGREDLDATWLEFKPIWDQFIQHNEEALIIQAGQKFTAPHGGLPYIPRPPRPQEDRVRDRAREEGARALVATP